MTEQVDKEIFRLYRAIAERKLERQEMLAKQIQQLPNTTINIFPNIQGNTQSYSGTITYKMGKAKLRHKYNIRFKPNTIMA
jgi:hypothetical protein